MTRFWTALSRALDPRLAAEELADGIQSARAGAPLRVAGGLVLATEAAGSDAMKTVRLLEDRWPGVAILGTSFEGILAEGRIVRDVPAMALLAWPEGPLEPIPLVFPPEAQDSAQIAEEILSASGRSELNRGDLVLLFPDALGTPQLEGVLARLGPRLGGAGLAGAAATGLDGHPAQAFFGDEPQPGALLGLFLPGDGKNPDEARVRSAAASRAASPWLEITACRARWIDGLDDEPPLDWVRRQLGLDAESPIEPHLDRLLARIKRRGARGEEDGVGGAYEERYVIGVDEKRGSFSVPGTFARGDRLALALPDAERARETLRAAIDSLPDTPLMLQFACRARDEAFHGDPDLESAWVAHHAVDRRILGTVSPFQLVSAEEEGGACRLLVHSTILASLGERKK